MKRSLPPQARHLIVWSLSVLIVAVALSIAERLGAQPPVINGWTEFTASVDSRVVYVDPSGSDASTGLSQAAPKRTIAAGAALLRDGFPDWLLLRSGATFAGGFPSWSKGGRSSTEPMRIGVYGGLARATILCGAGQGFGGFVGGATPTRHLAITSIALIADAHTGTSTAAGVSLLGSWADILLEDVLVARFHTNIVFQSNRHTETMHTIRLRRCVVLDALTTGESHAQGAFFAGIDGLTLEECTFDHNGWSETVTGATPTIFRHNLYIQGHGGAGPSPGSNSDDCTNVITRGLISSRAAATGLQQRPGGLCENSLFLHNPLNLVFGTYGGTVRDCVAVGSRDIDAGHPRAVGFNIVSPDGPKRVERCIAVGLPSPMGTGNVYAYAIDGAPEVVLEGCVSWRWKSAAVPPLGTAVNTQNAPMPTVVGGNMEQTPPAHEVSLAAYMEGRGGEAAWWEGIRAQSRANWRPEFTAAAFNDRARAAFGIAAPTASCYADCNASGALEITDFACMLTRYAAGEPAANCDGSTEPPVLNVADLTCFLRRFAQGCR